ncbi:MAG: hypothetical protein H7293_19910 [Candidatus Saccharibacteria bacterium]|nr:hypothetical protein [Rhodoferax sp.]
MKDIPEFQDSAFDLRARAELSLAFDPGQPPAHIFRNTPLLSRRGFQRGLAAFLCLGSSTSAVLAMRPPELVRGAIEHEYYERTLRGNFMEGRKILEHLGLEKKAVIPGFPQLMRPCDIDGNLVYHLTTFFEKGGMVTVFAFDQPVTLKEDSGWWGNVYWQVVSSRDGKPLVMVAQKKKALSVAHLAFGKPTG